jgi:hypothetical protein
LTAAVAVGTVFATPVAVAHVSVTVTTTAVAQLPLAVLQ